MPGTERHPLAQALAGEPGEGADLAWLSGLLVTAVDTTAVPNTVTVRLPDGATVPGVPCLGWWAPVLDARVEALRRGPALLVLGPVRGAASVAPPPAPAPPPSRSTVTVQPTDRGTWTPGGGYWKAEIIQGGELGKRAWWVYGDGIAAAKGSGTIVSGTVWVQRADTAHGSSGGANVRLGTHGSTALPATGGAGHQNVANVGLLLRGEGKAFPLTAAQVSALNAGSKGLGLEPGTASYSSPDYLVGVLAASGALALTVEA